MPHPASRVAAPSMMVITVATMLAACSLAAAEPRPMEFLDRGLVALDLKDGVFLSWRMLGTDRPDVAFHLYRDGRQVTAKPITATTNHFDPKGRASDTYTVAVVADGQPAERSKPVAVWPRKPPRDAEAVKRRAPGAAYLEIPLEPPPSEKHVPGDMSVGDLDGDGSYELVFIWEGTEPWIEAVALDGRQLWRIACGPNTRANGLALLVYDFDGDGKAEVACKTGPGTKDGRGNFLSLGPAAMDDDSVVLPNASKHLLVDKAYATIFEGVTGKELTTIRYEPALGTAEEMQANWGDGHGYRASSVKAAVLHHKDHGPLLVFTRGIYTRIAMAAFRWDGKDLKRVWTFDTKGHTHHAKYEGMGNHSAAVGDLDGDGSDELIYGACAIDHDGTGLYTTGRGHGDTHALGDLIPDRPGLEFYQGHENSTYGISMRDAATGEIIWEILSKADVGRAWAGDVTPAHPGAECTSIISPNLDCHGKEIDTHYNPYDGLIYFDGDVQRDIRRRTAIEDGSGSLGQILTGHHFDASDLHSTKHDANLVADIVGDWREEVVFRRSDNRALMVFTTWIPTERKNPTLMHDPTYRMNVVVQNIGYNQTAEVGYCFAAGPPESVITIVRRAPADRR